MVRTCGERVKLRGKDQEEGQQDNNIIGGIDNFTRLTTNGNDTHIQPEPDLILFVRVYT